MPDVAVPKQKCDNSGLQNKLPLPRSCATVNHQIQSEVIQSPSYTKTNVFNTMESKTEPKSRKLRKHRVKTHGSRHFVFPNLLHMLLERRGVVNIICIEVLYLKDIFVYFQLSFDICFGFLLLRWVHHPFVRGFYS